MVWNFLQVVKNWFVKEQEEYIFGITLEELRKHIVDLIHEGEYDLDAISKEANISKKTLERFLNKDHLPSYMTLKKIFLFLENIEERKFGLIFKKDQDEALK